MDGFKIKTLVWEEQDGKSYRQANCALGQYQVSWLVEFECWQLSRPPKAGQAWKDGFSRHSSKDAAKAAAQADYEAHILAAIEPQPAYVTLQRIGTGIYEVDPQPISKSADLHDPRDEVIKGMEWKLEVALAANRGMVRLNEMTEARVERLVEALEEIASYDTGATAGLAYTARAALAAAKAVRHD